MPFFMNCQSIYRDSRIKAVPMNKLSPMSTHGDGREQWKTLPTMKSEGMYYPIHVCKVDEKLWYNQVMRIAPELQALQRQPIVNEDGLIWGVKMGCNRFLTAEMLEYDSIDCIIHPTLDLCVQWARYFQHIDPLHNDNPEPFQGKFF